MTEADFWERVKQFNREKRMIEEHMSDEEAVALFHERLKRHGVNI